MAGTVEQRHPENWMPLAPLRSYLRRAGIDLDALPPGMRRRLHRGEWLQYNTADRYAVYLGVHPVEIWGDRWFLEDCA